MNLERYARQTIIDGWDQEKLTRTSLLIVGTDHLARFTSLLATAMGFGRVFLMGDGRVEEKDSRFLLFDVPLGASLVRAWAEALQRVNSEVEVIPVHDVPGERSFKRVPDIDLIVEASHDLRWKVGALRLAEKRNIDLIMAAAGPQVGLYQVGKSLCGELGKFQNVHEDPLVSLTLSALLVDEVRKIRLVLWPGDRPSSGPICISPEALHRRGGGLPPDGASRGSGHPPVITLVGAGGIGTWASIAIGLSARRHTQLRIFDPDGVVEPTNLNRQILFWDALGKPKALALSDRLNAMFPEVQAEGYAEAITETNIEEACMADLTLCGPDTFSARALLHRGALYYRKPLVNGGTSAFGANVAAYVPGRSPCLECNLRIETVAKAIRGDEVRARCAGVVEASVVTSNALAGALMAYQAWATLSGQPMRGVIEYDGRACGSRLGVRSVKDPCQCHQGAGVLTSGT